MLSSAALLTYELIKKAALGAMGAEVPTGICYGTVTSEFPLKITLEQKLTLTYKQLVLSSLVRDFDVDMTVDHTTEEKSGGSSDASFAPHSHEYKGKKTFKVHLGLKKGEKVMLLRMQGGQKFIVLDRIREGLV